MPEPRRTFVPVVLVAGLAAGALAMAGTQPWHSATGEGVYECEAPCVGVSSGDAGASWAFGLVMLAALGVVLVSRGRFRRLVASVGLLAAAGGVVIAVGEVVAGGDQLRDVAERAGATAVEVQPTGWLVVGVVATGVSVLAWLAAVAYGRHWPEMGGRYDTPSDSPPEDLWKAMDQGHDPTS
jgi:uncharacterized membrane protein (TIGR02234 family)